MGGRGARISQNTTAKKLSPKNIRDINSNMIVAETEKAFKMKVNYTSLSGNDKVIDIWVPRSATEYTKIGILKMKDWFKKNKQGELRGYIDPYIKY